MQITPGLSPLMPFVTRPSESSVSNSASVSSLPQASVTATPQHDSDTGRTLTINSVTSPSKTDSVRGTVSSTSKAQTAGTDTESTSDGSSPPAPDTAEEPNTDKAEKKETEAQASTPKKPNGEAMTEQEAVELKQLKAIDRETRQHELAHQIVGGQFAGGASYTYEQGADGNKYAVAGEVPIDYGPIPGDPQATIEKMRKVRAAALAPAEPSAKDRQVAAQAAQYMVAAQLELALQRSETANKTKSDDTQGLSSKDSVTRSAQINQAYGQQTLSPDVAS